MKPVSLLGNVCSLDDLRFDCMLHPASNAEEELGEKLFDRLADDVTAWFTFSTVVATNAMIYYCA